MARRHSEGYPGSEWCGMCGQEWPCEVQRLITDLAEANATIAAQRLALATMREALEHVLTESEWVKKRNEWSSHGQTVGMQPTADRACQEIHFIARQALAQPDDTAAALAGAVLAAGQAARDALLASRFPAGDTPDEIDAQAKAAIDGWDRVRAALRGHGAAEG